LFVLSLLAAAGGDLRAFERAAPSCPAEARYCFGIDLHIVVEHGAPVQHPRWFAEQIASANRLFAPADVAFELRDVRSIEAGKAEIETRLDRDLLGRDHFSAGVIHVFVVRRLADVDIAGEQIRGVHWRDRGDTSRRWVILSAIGSAQVLAHELGHFFGLPHSRYEVSIMNKKPRPDPPWEKRVFAAPELARIRDRAWHLVHRRALVRRNAPRPWSRAGP
jgi:hypothetical protein